MTARRTRERAVWVDVDLGAVRHNVGMLAERAAPASVLAVVKANAYGHGAVPVARAALAGGATWLGVARVEEGVELRRAGIESSVLVLSEAQASATAELVGNELTPMVAGEAAIDALAKAVVESARPSPLPIHVKVDTGMHRVGCPPERVVDLVAHATRATSSSSKASAPTSRWRTLQTIRTPPCSSTGSTTCWPHSRRAACARGSPTPRTRLRRWRCRVRTTTL